MQICDYGCGRTAIKQYRSTGKWCCSSQARLCKNFDVYQSWLEQTINSASKPLDLMCDYGCGNQAKTYFKGMQKWCCSEHQSSCPVVLELRTSRRSHTMSQIGEDGLTTFQRTSIKNAKYRGASGYLASAAKMKATKRAAVVDGLDTYSRTARKVAVTRSKLNPTTGMSCYEAGGLKAQQTGFLKGIYKDPSQVEQYERYVREVMKFTERSWSKMKHIIDPANQRGLACNSDLDHIFSKADGFDLGIDPEIIGHWTNLQILGKADNIRKGRTSYKSYQQLIEDANRGG